MNGNDALPPNWAVAKLGDLFEFEYGKGLIRKNRVESGKYPVYGSNGIVGYHDEFLIEGPVLIVGRKGAAGAVSYSANSCWPIDTTYFVRENENLHTKFSYYLLKSTNLAKHEKSTAIPGLNRNDVYDEKIFLPPLPEQRRIVAKIEELFTELDAGIASLRTAQTQLKTYRQALLKYAFEGKLTGEWRAANAEKLQPAALLLQRIADERQSRYESDLAEWEAGGKTSRKPRPLKELPPLSAAELAELPELPEGWAWVKVGNVSDIGTGVTPLKSQKKFYEDGTIPWVTSGALNDAYVTEPSGFVTKTALEETNLSLYPKHTLLVAMYGEGKTRGKCSELLIEATTNQAIAAIVQEGSSGKIRRYLKWFLQKNYDDLRLKSSGGVQPNLNLGIIASNSRNMSIRGW